MLVALAAIVGVATGCSGGGKGKGDADADTRQRTTTSIASVRATTPGPTATLVPQLKPDGSVPDPCNGLSQEMVSDAGGFHVEGDAVAHDNGQGFVSCTFKGALTDDATSGASIVIGAERATDTLDQVRATLADMSPGVKPTAVAAGDGGWSVTGDGFVEARVLLRDVQFTVSIVSPVATPELLTPAATKVEQLVVNRLGAARPTPPATSTTTPAPVPHLT